MQSITTTLMTAANDGNVQRLPVLPLSLDKGKKNKWRKHVLQAEALGRHPRPKVFHLGPPPVNLPPLRRGLVKALREALLHARASVLLLLPVLLRRRRWPPPGAPHLGQPQLGRTLDEAGQDRTPLAHRALHTLDPAILDIVLEVLALAKRVEQALFSSLAEHLVARPRWWRRRGSALACPQ
jgi:hypothetical protein